MEGEFLRDGVGTPRAISVRRLAINVGVQCLNHLNDNDFEIPSNCPLFLDPSAFSFNEDCPVFMNAARLVDSAEGSVKN